MPRIHLLTHWEAADPKRLEGATAVVIDVLLATTNIVIALAQGAERFLLARDRQETERIAGALPAGEYLRAGEVGADVIREYELIPLPSAFSSADLNGKTVIMNSTNGTKAVHACRSAGRIVLAALANAGAVADVLLRDSTGRITIVCAGNVGLIAYEDLYCGGLIVDSLLTGGEYKVNDAALVARDTYLQRKGDILPIFRESLSGRAIRVYSSEEEIRIAAREDTYSLIPEAVDNSSDFIEVRKK